MLTHQLKVSLLEGVVSLSALGGVFLLARGNHRRFGVDVLCDEMHQVLSALYLHEESFVLFEGEFATISLGLFVFD
jgi:hypothetical protein